MEFKSENLKRFYLNYRVYHLAGFDKTKTYCDYYTEEMIPHEKIIYTDNKYINIDNMVEVFNYGIWSKDSPAILIDEYDGSYIHKSYTSKLIVPFKNVDTAYDIVNIGTHHKFPKAYKFVNGNIKIYDIISAEFAKEIGLKESLNDGVFYKEGSFNPSEIPIPFEKFGFPSIGNTREDKIKYGILSPTNLISEGKNYTFGVEIETSRGVVPGYIAKDLNIKSVDDGSIRDNFGNKYIGGEYVTGVLRGDAGFKHLYKIVNELNKRCIINPTCSVHVHIGNVNFNKETVVMLWKLNQLLEAELFAIMPPSRLTKGHCKMMKHIRFAFNNKLSYKENINTYFTRIFKIISVGREPSMYVNKKFNHPAGNKCGYDMSTPRYWWLNFVPTLFNLKGTDNYTIEYRQHSATLNFTKIKNWILITQGIVFVAENYKQFVISSKKISLEDVMRLAYPRKFNYLMDYINTRKELFSSSHAALLEKIEYELDEIEDVTSKTLTETIMA